MLVMPAVVMLAMLMVMPPGMLVIVLPRRRRSRRVIGAHRRRHAQERQAGQKDQGAEQFDHDSSPPDIATIIRDHQHVRAAVSALYFKIRISNLTSTLSMVKGAALD
jgi:hypothetical protein